MHDALLFGSDVCVLGSKAKGATLMDCDADIIVILRLLRALLDRAPCVAVSFLLSLSPLFVSLRLLDLSADEPSELAQPCKVFPRTQGNSAREALQNFWSIRRVARWPLGLCSSVPTQAPSTITDFSASPRLPYWSSNKVGMCRFTGALLIFHLLADAIAAYYIRSVRVRDQVLGFYGSGVNIARPVNI